MTGTVCSTRGCGRPVHNAKRGLCRACYEQLRRREGGIKAQARLGVLLQDFARRAPHLPGAACSGRHELYDTAAADTDTDMREYARNAAVRLCGECGAINACRAWVESLPAAQRRQMGVVAGRVTG